MIPKKVFIRAGNQPENLGDVMLIRGLVEFFQKYGAKIYVDTVGHSTETLSEFNLNPENIAFSQSKQPNPSSITGLLKMLWRKQYDIISHYPGMAGFSTVRQHLLKRLPLILIYGLLKLRGYIVLYPNCSWNSNMLTNLNIRIEKIFAKACTLYGVRDKQVTKFLNENGLKKAQYVQDIFFQNQIFPPKAPQEQNLKKKILINLRDSIPELAKKNENQDFHLRLLTSLTSLLTELSQNHEITLCFQCVKDAAFMRTVHQHLQPLQNITLIDEYLTAEKAYTLYQSQDMIISNRLHCVLFAYLTGSRGIALTDSSAHTKLISSLKTYETNVYSLDIHQSPDVNKQKIDEWLTDDTLPETFNKIARTAQNRTYLILTETCQLPPGT